MFLSRPILRSLGAAAALGVFALVLTACSEPQQSQQQPPPPVRFVTVAPSDVAVEQEYAGRIRGSREVEVRSRVGGILLERLYNEGQRVAADDDLFLIDPDAYEIAVSQAEAELANARARFKQAEREWKRISGLYERDAVSERERDRTRSELELAEAGMALARAGLASAQLNLDWTRVSAPISGITGLETLSEGSLIDTGALLTTITQTDPVHVRFSLPERDATMQRRARRAMTGDADRVEQQASLVLADGSHYNVEGSIDFTDATIDPRTGSVSARAVFPNPEGELVPGQFVRIRMTTQKLEDIYRVPRAAISQGNQGSQAFVVGSDDHVSARSVKLGPVMGKDQVVLSGLEQGDRIIVSGLVNLRDGMPVNPQPAAASENDSDDGA